LSNIEILLDLILSGFNKLYKYSKEILNL